MMNRRMLPSFPVVCLVLTSVVGALTSVGVAADVSALSGRWRIDLRPAPEADPYYQWLEFEVAADGSLAGSFYGAPFRDAQVNDLWGDVQFSFVTNDGSGDYHTSGVLRDGRIEGRTHSMGRDFLMPWRAIRSWDGPKLSASEARADVDLLRRALEDIHPGLTRYVDERELDAAFELVDASLRDGIDVAALYREVSIAAATIRCGHTRVEEPDALALYRDETPTILPFTFEFIDGRMIVDHVAPGVPLERGLEIESINGVAVRALAERIAPTVPIDGFTDAARWSRLSAAYEYDDSGFDHFLPLFEGWRDDFMLEVKRVDDEPSRLVRVAAITRTAWMALGGVTSPNFSDSIALEFLDEDTAILTVGSFINYRNVVDPMERLMPVFEEINRSGVEHLILDLRSNGGGSSDAIWGLASFLIRSPVEFKAPLLKNYRFDASVKPHLQTWAPEALNMPDEAFIARADGWYELRPEVDGRATELAPHPDRFDGSLTVLTSPYNASGTTMLMATLQERGRARLVGDSTAGSVEGPTAGVLFTLTLPNSGIRVNIPVLFERTPIDGAVPGVGVEPDVKVAPTVEDFRAGRDVVLERAVSAGAAGD